MRDFLVSLTRNPVSLLGAAITTSSAVLIFTLFGVSFAGFEGGPYLGILTYLFLPAVFLAGLLLIPLGVWFERRRTRLAIERGEAAPGFPVIDLNKDRTRRGVLFFVAASVVNVTILGVATYKGVEVMDSTEFCGETCHSVMHPEFTTYQRSPHARVGCVSCHIGPGADWFVKSKLSGSWQLVSVALDLYPRPIPTPVHNLRPARETCEQCHWPSKFVGDRLKVITTYAEDEKNTELKTVLLLHVGGSGETGSHGIHWHVDPDIEVRYRSDESREIIHEIELVNPQGDVARFATPESRENQEDEGHAENWRIMDCVDCHNRPSHIYRLPAREVDKAIQNGQIDRGLPFVRREALRILAESYASHEEARRRIPEAVEAFYRRSYPEIRASAPEAIAAAGKVLAEIWCVNVFPSMKITWGTYANHIGHQDFPGCFRCHNDEHATVDGRVVSQDCSTCHTLLAIEEENPEILARLE